MMKRLGKVLMWSIVSIITAILLLQMYFFVQIWWWVDHNPPMTSFMREQLSVLQEKNPKATLKFQWVPYNRISNHLKRGVIAAEDAGFIHHDGVDWEALQDAYEKNLKKGRVVRGGSTITQQLAKNLFLSGDRSYIRKGQEMVIASMLELLMDKQRILEIYLNVAEWGVGVFGAEAAARHYYGQSAASLSVNQAARLAVMLPRPRYYDKNRSSAYLAQRAERVQRWMNSIAVPAR